MKSLLPVLFLLISLNSFTQYFAPENATWHYKVDYYIPTWGTNMIEGYTKVESIGDSIINNKVCSTLKYDNPLFCYFQPDTICVYYSNDSVFFYDTLINNFQLLYDFNASTGDSWEILIAGSQDFDTLTILVDSTDMIYVNGEQLKRQYVAYSVMYDHEDHLTEYNSVIIERIGDVNYLLNFIPGHDIVCDGGISDGLRCYQDNILGPYVTSISESCEYIAYAGVEELEGKKVLISPNPVSDHFSVKGIEGERFVVSIYDLNGKSVKNFDGADVFSVSALYKGIYNVKITLEDGQVYWQRLSVN